MAGSLRTKRGKALLRHPGLASLSRVGRKREIRIQDGGYLLRRQIPGLLQYSLVAVSALAGTEPIEIGARDTDIFVCVESVTFLTGSDQHHFFN